MGSNNGFFGNYSSPDIKLSEDFESSVFRKIRIKKRRKRVAVSTLGILFLGVMIFIGSGGILKRSDGVSPRLSEVNKRDVMLTDDVVFATFDGQNSYIVENIGEDNDDISI